MSKPRVWTYSSLQDYEAAMREWLATSEGQEHEARILAERERDVALAAAAEPRERDRELVLAGLPPKDVRLARAGALETEATRAIAGADGAVILVVSGNTGVGKTSAASLWLAKSWAAGNLFVKAARLARWDCYNTEEMDSLLDAPRLVIDDLGVEYADAKGRFLAVLTEVLDTRYDRALPTVITTGLTAAEFRTRYRERIADRIRESGRFVSLAGASMRGPGARS